MITNPANTTLRGPLFLGSNSDDVKRMQQSLNERSRTILTANVFPLSADGAFGMKTDKGVRAFQSFQKLAVDGIVGKKTSAALGFSNFIEAPRPAYVPPMRPPGVDPIIPQNGQAGPARPQDSPLHQIAHELGKIYSILANEVANYFRKIANLIDINIERFVNRWIHMVKNISGSVYTNLINLGNNIQAAGQFIRNSSRQIAEEMRALVQGACSESVILAAVLGPSEAHMYNSIINIGNGAERVCSGAGGTVTDFANSGLSLVYGLLGTLGAIVKEYA